MKAFLKALMMTKKFQVIAACVLTTAAVGAGVAIPVMMNQNSTESVVESGDDSVILAEVESSVEESFAPKFVEEEIVPESVSEEVTVAEESGQEVSVANTNNKKENKPSDKKNETSAEAPVAQTPTEPSEEQNTVYHTINFVTNSNSTIPARQVADQEALSNLPNAKKLNNIFDGWFYEETLATPVKTDDVVTRDLTLYAKYQEAPQITSKETASAIIRNDVEADFKIGIVSTMPYDLATAKQFVAVENLFDADTQAMTLSQRADGVFELAFMQDGFDAGASYKVRLLEDSFYFEGENPDVKEYNFTATATPVNNMKYMDGIVYLGVDEFSDIIINGKPAERFSISLFSIYQNGEQVIEEETKGSFKSAARLTNGTIVTLYDGIRPDLRTVDTPADQCGDVAYVEITGYDPSTSTYFFKKAQADEVIFIPDMLPLNVADAGVVINGDELVIKKNTLDFSADIFASIGLDSQTTIDKGDFFVFYEGDFDYANTSAVTYVEILSVEGTEDEYIIKISDNKDWDYVSAAMDVYNTQNQDLSSNLSQDMVAKIEKDVENQALNSGFAEEAGMYLASLAMATDTFTTLSEDMDLTDYRVVLDDGTPVSPEQVQLMAKDAKVEVSKPKVKAKLSTELQEFDEDDLDGLRLTLSITTKITIHASKKADIEIQITGDFVQELRIDLGMKAKAVWKVWGIFPYIDEYRINADIDMYEYTGVSVHAEITTAEAEEDDDDDDDDDKKDDDKKDDKKDDNKKDDKKDDNKKDDKKDDNKKDDKKDNNKKDDKKDNKKDDKKDDAGKKINTEASNLAGELKKLMDKFDSDDDDDSDDEISISTSLTEKYKDMLENESDWVELYSIPMVELKTMLPPCCPIIAVEFEADFVIEANANVSLGMDFYYKNAKRYNYTIDVFAKKVYNNVINLCEEQYELDAYVMGTLGLRAGIKLELKIGLFSTDLDSVGFTIEGGAYLKLYGYFFYKLSYTASQGRSQEYSGALYIELGAFLEIGVEAQVLKGKYSTEASLYEEEWPLLSVGRQENVLDFVIEQKDLETIKLKQYIRSAILPDDIFEMNYLDLKEGDEETKVFSDNPDDDDFVIELSNNKFTYDYKSNTITVNPAEGDVKLEADMTITWNSGPLAFTSSPIQRTLKITWDDLRDGYVIVPYTNGGSYVPIIMAQYEANISVPTNPVKPGYVFMGWFADEALTVPYTFPEKMSNKDTDIYAKWEEATDTRYRVRFYQQKVDSDEYVLVKTIDGAGRTNSTVTPATDVYEGFNTPAAESLTILPDGSAVMNYYYTRVIKHVTFTPGIVSGDDDVYEYKYGARVSAPIFAATGYVFTGWDKEVASTMGAQDVTYVAQWETAKDTKYRLEYYVQDEEGSYRLAETIAAQGETASEIAMDSILMTERYASEALSLESVTVNGVDLLKQGKNPVIGADGKTVVKIYYGRGKTDVTFVPNNEEENYTKEFYLDSAITYPSLYKEGYLFAGWYLDEELQVPVPEQVIATKGLTVYAKWEEKASLVLKHYIMTIEGEYDLIPVRTVTVDALRGENYQIADYIATDLLVEGGIEFESAAYGESEAVEEVTAAEGKNQISMYYKRVQHNLTWILGDGTASGDYSVDGAYYYEQPITAPIPEKHGFLYDFDKLPPAKMPAEDVTITVIWTETDKMSVKILDYDNRVLFEVAGYVGDPVEMPELEINRPGYNFTGFTGDIPKVFGETNVTIKALYELINYEISYELNGGAFKDSDVPVTTYNVESENILLPVPTKRGYTFLGWYETEDFTGDAVSQVTKGSTESKTFRANWKENRYTIRFLAPGADNADSVDVATQATMNLGYEETATLLANPYSKAEYALMGWATTEGGDVTYADQASISRLSDEDGAVITLYAVFIKGHHIYYNNLGDGVMPVDVVSFFSRMSSDITLDAPATNKTGYTFAGWYTTDNYREGTEVTVLTPSSLENDVVLYAKWVPNPYTVIFDANLKSGKGEETQLMAYDKKQALVSFSSVNFENPGYSFQGWTTEQNSGRVDYTDGEEVQNLATHGNIRLYAVWQAVKYSISYDLRGGATGNSNPTDYYVTSEDINLAAPTEIGAGYKFMGWVSVKNGVETPITQIQKGSHENLNIVAKWQHAGIFSLSYVSTTSGTSTYRITRTIPEGAQALSEDIIVYYRTENGTAVGGTATAINFLHVGGPEVYKTFSAADGNGSSKTFTVSGENANGFFADAGGRNLAASVVMKKDAAAKYYTVKITEVKNTTGGVNGVINSANKTVTRRIGTTTDIIDPNVFKLYATHAISGEHKIVSDSYDGNWSFGADLGSEGLIKNFYPGYSQNLRQYIINNIISYEYFFECSMREEDDGNQYVRFKVDDNYMTYTFEIDTSLGAYTDWTNNVVVPATSGQGKITGMSQHENNGGTKVWREGSGTDAHMIIASACGNYKVQFDASGASYDNWWMKNIVEYVIPTDVGGPRQIGIAPIAYGNYKKGETVVLAVEFNEVVDSATAPSNLASRLTSLGIPTSSAKIVNAYGSNVVCVEATLNADLNVTDSTLNRKLLSNTSLLEGFTTDILGNNK